MLLAPVVRGERERRQEHCHILFSHSVHIGNSEYTEAPPWCFGPRHATTYLNFAATVQLQTEPIVAILRSRDCVHLRAIAIIIRIATSQWQLSSSQSLRFSPYHCYYLPGWQHLLSYAPESHKVRSRMTSLYRLGSIVHNLEDHNPRRKEWVRQCTQSEHVPVTQSPNRC